MTEADRASAGQGPGATSGPASVQPPGLAGMHPAYFALVMATGIVSIASELLGMHAVAVALFALDLAFYPPRPCRHWMMKQSIVVTMRKFDSEVWRSAWNTSS